MVNLPISPIQRDQEETRRRDEERFPARQWMAAPAERAFATASERLSREPNGDPPTGMLWGDD